MKHLPYNESHEDDGFASLADLMSFVAIIFLLLFVVSGHGSSTQEESNQLSNGEEKSDDTVTPPVPTPQPPKNAGETGGNKGSKGGGAKGLAIKFASRADLISLIRSGVVSIYCVVSGDEFQLVFLGKAGL